MARPSRRARIRPSVVVTFAASASLLACGGQVNGGSSGGPNDSGTETNPIDCPATAPTTGNACDGTITCEYPTCYSSTNQYACRDGRWVETIFSSCNPPAPACPSSAPALGSACSPPSFCRYADTCVDRPASSDGFDQYWCNAGAWGITNEYLAKCPASAPVDGASCACGLHSYTATCTYPGSCSFGVGDAIATCDATSKTWRVMHSTCNPPGPDGGPVDVGTFDVGGTEVSISDAGPGH
jgi:hypothetical protein